MFIYLISIWFENKNDNIKEPAYATQTNGKQIYNSHYSFSFIEFVGSQKT